MSLDLLRECAEHVEQAPPLRRINGFGFGLYGILRDPELNAPYWNLYFFSALWLPILPLTTYLVVRTENGFRFYRKLSLWNLCRVYRSRVFGFYISALLEGVGWLIAFGLMIVIVLSLIAGLRGLF